jgi:hypothetical protein
MTDPLGTNTAALGGPFSPANGVPTGSNTSTGSSSPPVVTGNSLIFTSASSQYLSATGKTSINQQKFTIAAWFKTSTVALADILDFSDGTTANRIEFLLNSTAQVQFIGVTANSTIAGLVTSASFADGNWHHVLLAVDTTQATNTNRLLLYVDGALVALSSSTYPAQNTNLSNNFAATYDIGSRNGTARFFNGKLAQVYYIDGQQLTPSSFISGTPGVPITYTGSYTGTFDFFLSFSNGASTTTLGLDSSGEGNNWTLNAMTTANQSTDYP